MASYPSFNDFLSSYEMEVESALKGESTPLQRGLRELQKKWDLKVVNLEEFFTAQVQRELEETGYKSDVYYHASFTVGQAEIMRDLIYKPVTDIFAVREWSLTNQKLLNFLNMKGLSIPKHFDEDFLRSMRRAGQNIIGAEILVIEATKK
jgi:hypothetical protein